MVYAGHRKKFLSHGRFDKEYETGRDIREELRIAGTWNRKNCAECAKRKTSLTPPRFPARGWQALDCPRVLFKFAGLYPKIDRSWSQFDALKNRYSRGIVMQTAGINFSRATLHVREARGADAR